MFRKKFLNKKIVLIFLVVISYHLVTYFLSTSSEENGFFGNANKSYPFSVNVKNTNYTYPINTLTHDDFSRLINITNFNFTLVPKKACSNDTLLLILVHSAPQHFKHRELIRKTWGAPKSMLQLVFLVGSVTEKQLQLDLEKESQLHSDLAQGNFIDTYRNLTYKHLMAFKYAIYRCPIAKYILKTDDDVFVNMPLMQTLLAQGLSIYGASNLLFCNVIKDALAIRDSGSKWLVTLEEYPNATYPNFCLGWTVMYSPDVLFSLYKSGQKEDFFWVDDVYITGILAEKNHILHTDVNGLLISAFDFWLLKYTRIEPKKYFLYGRPDLQLSDIEMLWKYVISHPIP